MKTIILLMMLLLIIGGSVQALEEEMAKKNEQYLVRLMGTRDGWPDGMTESEIEIMEEHFAYLKNLVAAHKVILAGPVFDFRIGLIILQVENETELLEIMKNEPSVAQGVHTYEYSPMVVSLLAEYHNPDRYADKESDKVLHKQAKVQAALEDVWNAWTTTEGVNTFFSPHAKVDLRVGGPYEIYFSTESPTGQRGSEDCKILSYLDKQMLSFEWNAPPSLGEMRGKHTRVVILFKETEPGQVLVDFYHVGWGEGERWQQVYDYFDKAWSYVLSNFKKRFAEGPLSWE